MMRLRKTLWLMSASGLVIMSCSPNAQANILPRSFLPDAITSVYNTHFTYTSHPEEMLLSSAFYPLPENPELSILPLPKALGNSLFYSLPENSGRAREGLTIPPSPALGRAASPLKDEVNQSPSDSSYLSSSDTLLCHSRLDRESRSDKTADSFNLDPRIKSEDDKLISEKQGDNKNIQLASVCFVTDTNDCSGNEFANADDDNGHGAPGNQDDYDLDNAERCKKEGYNKTSCLPGEIAENFCPYDSNYFEKCVCPDGYKTCTPPYYGVGTACGNKYASCEKDTQRACKELNSNYTNTCGTGQQLSSDRCSYDSSYGTCCNTCAGYDNTSIPEGYVQDGEACVDCNGQTKYKIKINPCDGFLDCGSMGPDTGASTCLSGSITKYNNCKPCPNKGTLTSCPSPYTCTYEECSGRYYKSGCQSGYDWNSSKQTCTAQCSSYYKYTCTPNSDPYLQGGSGEACNGKYTTCSCTSGYYWNGTKCATCVNKLEDGWTYNGDSCPYGYLTYESINDPSQCYHAKYKCNSCNNCQPGQFLIAGSQYNGSQTYKCSNTPPAPSIPGWGYTYSDDDIIIMIESTNSQLCQYNIYSLREIETTDQCEYYPHDEKILKTVYANKTKINAALTQLGKNPLPEDLYYPNPSCIKNGQLQSPCTGGPSDRLAVGKFNMNSGSLTEGYETCQESSGWGGIAPDKAHHLIIEKYNCQGEICKLEKTLPDKTSGF